MLKITVPKNENKITIIFFCLFLFHFSFAQFLSISISFSLPHFLYHSFNFRSLPHAFFHIFIAVDIAAVCRSGISQASQVCTLEHTSPFHQLATISKAIFVFIIFVGLYVILTIQYDFIGNFHGAFNSWSCLSCIHGLSCRNSGFFCVAFVFGFFFALFLPLFLLLILLHLLADGIVCSSRISTMHYYICAVHVWHTNRSIDRSKPNSHFKFD